METPLPEFAKPSSDESDPPLFSGSVTSPSRLRFYTPTGEPLVTVYFDGRVEVNPQYTMDEAAAAFWEAVRKWGTK